MDDSAAPVDQIDDETEALGPEGKKKSKAEQMYSIYTPRSLYTWNIVICDEAHLLKNKKSGIHKAVKCLDRRYFLAVTATPMLNTVLDMLSLLLLSMPKATATYTPSNYSYYTMYGSGDDLGLVDPEKDPRESGYISSAHETATIQNDLSLAEMDHEHPFT